MPNTSRRLALGLTAIAVLAASASAAENKQFRYTVQRGATVSVVNEYGQVRLRPASGNQVVVTAAPASAKAEVSAAQNGNRIDLRTRLAGNPGESQGRVDYEIQAPADANVIIRTATGPVQIAGINGNISVDADTGPVEVRDSRGHVRVRTVGGPITLSQLDDGVVEATSVGGLIKLSRVSGKMVSADTTAGSIAYEGDFGGAGQYSLSSHSGNVDVVLPASASVEVSARTVNGTVENDFSLPPTASSSPAIEQRKSFAGTLNSGASAVRLRTFSGKIRVKKQ